MTLKSLLTQTLCAAAITCAGQMAIADTFDVALGKKSLGTFSHTRNGQTQTLKSTLSNTPLGVFNGSYKATSKPSQEYLGQGAVDFDGLSKSSRKSRRIQITIGQAGVLATAVDPTSEMTDLSDPARVPPNVVDPVRAIDRLIHATDCPSTFSIYDGRRVIKLTPTDTTLDGDTRTCTMGYKVVAGPGHLSPLRISRAKMTLTYAVSGTTQSLTRLTLTAKTFTLKLTRR